MDQVVNLSVRGIVIVTMNGIVLMDVIQIGVETTIPRGTNVVTTSNKIK